MTSKNSTEKQQKPCVSCHKKKDTNLGFYNSNSKFDADGRMSICRECVKKSVDVNDLSSVKKILLEINRPYLHSFWNNSIVEGQKKNQHPLGLYLKTLQLNNTTKELTWLDSEDENSNKDKDLEVQNTSNSSLTDEDQKNKEDVIRMVGYDPFYSENEDDKRGLYNKLVDFLDESTLEDSFKLPVVIEIVKMFNQIDKMNSALAIMFTDTKSMATNTGSISSLIATKEKMLKTVLALAKDNGISVNHNNNKSKGGNTLNGIVKKLNEIGLEAATVNVFDLETCDAMKQIADVSHRSILDQLVLDENDYAEMLSEQRDLIKKFEEKASQLEEENRQLKIKVKELESKIS